MAERNLWNFYEVEDGKKTKRVPLAADDVAARLLQLVHPAALRRVASDLCAVDYEKAKVAVLGDANGLFGWVQSQHVNVFWNNTTPGCIPKGEFLAFLKLKVQERVAVRELPHHPRVSGIEYLCDERIGEECHGALEELVDFWLPATPFDRALMMAAFCTPFWGGPGGSRPAISIESDGADNGRGIGKSQLMYAISNVAGGHIDGSLKDDIGFLKKRLLTEGTRAGVVAFDNCKASRVSSAELEGLITAPTVSGWRPHHGNADIPNLLTYIFTMNDAAFSADMSSRSVRVVLSRKASDSSWQRRLDSFIDKCRREIVEDCIFYLRAEPKEQSSYIRFAKWQLEVLSKIDGSDEIAALLKSRQEDVDADAEAAEDLKGMIMHRLAEYKRPGLDRWKPVECDPEKDSFLIARAVVCDWIRSRYDRTATDHALTQALRRARIENLIDRNDIRSGVRYWLWTPNAAFVPALREAWRIDSLDTGKVLRAHKFKCTKEAGADVIELNQTSTTNS